MIFKSIIIFIVALICSNNVVKSQSYNFLHVSDVHFSSLVNTVLYNDTTLCIPQSLFKSKFIQDLNIEIHKETIDHSGLYGRYGCDTNMELYNSTIQEMQYIDEHPDFVIFTGDSAGHALPYDYWTTSVAIFSKMFSEAYSASNTTFIPTIGNNDVFPDYNVSCKDNNLEFLYSVWGEWIPQDQVDNFLSMGAFAVNPVEGLTVLSLNTVLYSVKQRNTFGADPCGQFQWLQNQLNNAVANNHSVYIIGHIFPGLDPFFQIETWKEQYIFNFYDIIKNYTNTVKAGFFGHIHRDEYRSFNLALPPIPDTSSASENPNPFGDEEERVDKIIEANDGDMFFPLYIGSAISPLYQNNPSFKLFQVTPQFEIYNISTYYTDIYVSNYNGYANWTLEYNFADEYHISDDIITGETLSQLTTAFYNNPKLYARYDDHRAANYLPDIIDSLCLTTSYSDAAWTQCVNQHSLSAIRRLANEFI